MVLHTTEEDNTLPELPCGTASFDFPTRVRVAVSLGTGVYVLLPRVAREEAGPAVVLSFLVAAVASCLADAEKCRALRAIGAAETRRNP
ncbi:hypothetical protein MRX96_045315 [Rhipicephalus microplus]